jgi:hypothetical protein
MAQIKNVCGGRVDVIGDGEERSGLPLLSPKGISWTPEPGDRALLVPYEGNYICLGVIQQEKSDGLKISSGEAYIKLNKDGSVVINGLVISKEGQFGGG